ncbi:MAG: Na/Pi cotransporter family protein [Bacteroidia bacterium]|nr:Na/Pi cotransporter family protein [Bacteroidia bacterium]
MAFGLGDLIQIAGALAFFIYGMKLMSDGIQRAAGSQLRNILRGMTKNRYLGVFTGFLITALVQSSSATTVMTVSFVNAGLMTLVESAGVMMGANIGTTITGWLISILGFKVQLSAYSIPLFAFALPMLFSGRGKLKYWGEFIIGFAILFLGLSYLKDAVPDLKSNPEALEFLANFTEWGILSRLFFVLVGTLITIIVQSSSAAMAITLTLCANGILPFDVAAAMILGENIGTTITAELASLVGNTNAKRSARIHSMFNIIGVTWMVILLPVILPFLANFVQITFEVDNPYNSSEAMPIGLSAFHTAFNATNVIVLLFFVPWLVKAAIWSVPLIDGEEDDNEALKFIDTTMLTPELATIELQKEAAHFGNITAKMSDFFSKLLKESGTKKQLKLIKKIGKYEQITDIMEISITEYITKITNEEVTPGTSARLRSILNICNDLERIGDLYAQIAKVVDRKIEEGIFFVPEQRQNLLVMSDLIIQAFDIMKINLNQEHYDDIHLGSALAAERAIDEFRNKIREAHYDSLGKSTYDPKASIIYSNIYELLEGIGDHIMNVNESIAGQI